MSTSAAPPVDAPALSLRSLLRLPVSWVTATWSALLGPALVVPLSGGLASTPGQQPTAVAVVVVVLLALSSFGIVLRSPYSRGAGLGLAAGTLTALAGYLLSRV